jgi:signal transduction histidine kinase
MRAGPLRLAIAVLITAVATAVGYFLNVELHTAATFLTFFPALFACTWLAGRTGGLLGLALSTLPVAYILPPVGTFYFHQTVGAWTAICTYLVTGFIVIQTTSRLQQAIVWRDRLVAMVSHDLKSPLSTMGLVADILRRGAQAGTLTPEKATTQADRITRQVNRLVLMVNNLLDMSRVRAGKLNLTLDEIDLVAIIKDVVGRFSADLDGARGSVTITGADQPLRGRWDRMALEQITANLLSNAIKYGQHAPIEILLGRDQAIAIVEVHDGGPGMSPEAQRRVFDEFRRGDATPLAPGHGLGLWIVRRYVKALGGRVSLRSSAGAGTTFRVELPI